MQTAGRLVGAFAEFAAEFEDGHDAFERRNFQLRVFVDRNAAPVVFDRNGAVDVDDDRDFGREPGQRFVDRVVDDFRNEVVEAAGSDVADVHRRTDADVFAVAQMLHILRRVGVGAARRFERRRDAVRPVDGRRGVFERSVRLFRLGTRFVFRRFVHIDFGRDADERF